MKQAGKLTIVLPMYNVEKYVVRCLKSIYDNPESWTGLVDVILVDDGSPDNSAEVAEEYLKSVGAANYSIVRQENRGLGGARNAGLRLATSAYIWFIDSDDEIPSTAIADILSHIGEGKDFYAFSYRTIPASSIKNPSYPVKDEEAAGLVGRVNFWCVPFNVYSVDFLKTHGLEFKEKFLHEDNEFTVRLIASRPTVSYYPECIYLYHSVNTGSINNSVSLKALTDSIVHLNSCEEAIAENQALPDNVKATMHQTCAVVMATVFRRSLYLDESDWREFSQIIKDKKPLIYKTHRDLPFYMKYFNLALSLVRNRTVYKIAFVIKSLIEK